MFSELEFCSRAAIVSALVFLFIAGGSGLVHDVSLWVFWVAVVVGLLILAFNYWVWRTEEYLVTNRRMMKVTGVINKRSADSSLEKINDAILEENLLGRILNYGALQIQSAGENDGLFIAGVPDVEDIQRMVYELIEADAEQAVTVARAEGFAALQASANKLTGTSLSSATAVIGQTIDLTVTGHNAIGESAPTAAATAALPVHEAQVRAAHGRAARGATAVLRAFRRWSVLEIPSAARRLRCTRPTVAAAIGASAYAGIPITYPGAGDALVLLRGYEDTAGELPNVNWPALAALDGEVDVVETGCMGRCDLGPVSMVHPDGTFYKNVVATEIPKLVEEHFLNKY